jgi:hypothetical protein
VCVPEECQPSDLEGDELREWLMLQHARIEGDNTATPTQLHYLQNLVEIGEVARNTWTGKSFCQIKLVKCYHLRKISLLAASATGIRHCADSSASIRALAAMTAAVATTAVRTTAVASVAALALAAGVIVAAAATTAAASLAATAAILVAATDCDGWCQGCSAGQ